MKKKTKKLLLSLETLRNLQESDLQQVGGGVTLNLGCLSSRCSDNIC